MTWSIERKARGDRTPPKKKEKNNNQTQPPFPLPSSPVRYPEIVSFSIIAPFVCVDLIGPTCPVYINPSVIIIGEDKTRKEQDPLLTTPSPVRRQLVPKKQCMLAFQLCIHPSHCLLCSSLCIKKEKSLLARNRTEKRYVSMWLG